MSLLPNLPFANTWLAGAFWLAFLLWVATEALLVAPGVRWLEHNQDRGSALGIIGSVGIAVVLAMGLARLHVELFDAVWLQWVGVVLMLAGIAFRHYVVRYLGRFFTPLVTVQSGQHVITSGPFSLVRHPSYLGTLITMIGFGLALGCWPAVLLTPLLAAPAYVYRMLVEEKVMLAAFGDEYRRYAAHKKRIIPFVC